MRVSLYLFLFCLTFSYTTSLDLLTKFNITLKTPGNTSSPPAIPYKSIHVQYRLPSSNDRWNIVEIEPSIRISNQLVQQMTVHLCQVVSHIYQENSIWYDDETRCHGAPSILIYQWTSYLPSSSFRISDDLGFQLNKSKSIVLTVTYSKEQQIHERPTGVILYISTLTPRYQLGTTVAGNKQRGTHFSCRSLNYPRLLYAVQPLFPKNNNSWWRIYVIRNRSFGRKLVQYALDSSIVLNRTKNHIEIIPADIFLMPGDYMIVECEEVFDTICQFLIFYIFKNIPYEHIIETDHTCKNNDYPDLFKLLPSKTILETTTSPSFMSNIDSTTTFLLVCLLLFVMWISIIMGCLIMRRIRGLVNYRPESSDPFAYRGKKPGVTQKPDNNNDQKMSSMGDQIAQLDIEHMGLMS